jgi:hypothetical protein
MTSKGSIARRLITLALIAGAELAVALPLNLPFSTPAYAQFFLFDNRPRRPAPPSQPGFQLFPPFLTPEPPKPPPVVDYSRAPAPRKAETPPSNTIVVMGDSMADWLAYGLEDAVTDMPGLGIVRKHRTTSGLIRYDTRADMDWARAAREILATEKPAAIVMMIGLNDRQAIRVQPAGRGAAAPPPPPQDQPKEDAENPDIQIIAPEPPRVANGTYEFHSDRWNELYIKRIDDTIAALKSKGVPVIWVGLPSMRGPKAMADSAYLNDLYRARAEKAGIIYVDVWDGFVDEGGKFAAQGPDVEGQIRRLRANDGVHFTKPGARKLAHYVEREIRRVMLIRSLPVALPSDEAMLQPLSPTLRPGITASRPLAGAIVPLTNVSVFTAEEMLGGGGARPAASDPIAARVLIKGEAVAPPKGRADDFVWPRRSSALAGQAAPENAEPQTANLPMEDSVPEPAATSSVPSPALPRDANKKSPVVPAKQAGPVDQGLPSLRNPVAANPQKPKPPAVVSRETPPRPPASIGSPFSWFR